MRKNQTKPSSPSQRTRSRKRRIVIALLIYSVVGFFILPAIIKWQLVKRLPGLTHRNAVVQKVKLNPYALSFTIRGLSLTETNGEPFAAIDEFYINFQLSSLFRWAWTFSEIKLTHPTGNIVRDANGQFNFANLLTNAPPTEPASTNQSKSLPVVIVQRLIVTNGNVAITDHTRAKPFHTEYGPIDLELKDFTTRRNRNEPYFFVATTSDGERFAWSGKISVNPPRSTGEFKLSGIPLKKYSPYFAEIARIDLTDGVFGVGANYRLDADAIPLELEVTNATVTLSSLEVKAQDNGELLLALKNFSVSDASASLAAHVARVSSVAVDGGSVLARRESDGKINWLALLVAQTNASPDAVTQDTNALPTAPSPWKAALDEFKVEGFNVTVEDRTTPTPAQIGLDNLSVNVKGVSNQSNAPVAANISLNWRGGGTVNVSANGTIMPPTGEAKIAITNLALPPVQPFIEQQARLVLNAGDLNVNGLARYTPETAQQIQFTGDVSIAKFATMDTVAYHDFLKWDNLSLHGIQVSLQTNSLSVDEIKFTKLETSLVVSSNGQLNVQALLRKKATTNTTTETTNVVAQESVTATDSFPIKVGALVFEKSSFRAADQSLTPRFNTSIEEFDGSIRDITLPGLTKATVDIHGKVSALAPFSVVGSVTPNATNPFLDMKITFTNSDLTPFISYTEKFVGRPLNKGKLTFDLQYNIENRQLKAGNVITLDQLTFGARNENTNATKLPVKLAVSLLKDRNGRIDLDLPVAGSMDDPQFNIGGLVWKAIMNIILKVAASPFSLLGALVGGGEELQYVDFAPGLSTLDGAQTNKLDKLTKALYERPALSLEISGSVDFAADSEAIARQKLRDKMKSLRVQELTERGKSLPADFVFEEDDYDRLLRKTYKESFNTTPERALREAQAAAAKTNASASNTTLVAGRSTEATKGAARLIQATPDTTVKATTNTSPDSSTAPAKPKTQDELVREELEHRLAATAPATDDELRELMQRRAESVQKYFLATDKITADRLFLVAPKPIDPAVRGMSRANFSLD